MARVSSRYLLIGIAAILAFAGCRHLKGNVPLQIEMVGVKGAMFMMGDLFDKER